MPLYFCSILAKLWAVNCDGPSTTDDGCPMLGLPPNPLCFSSSPRMITGVIPSCNPTVLISWQRNRCVCEEAVCLMAKEWWHGGSEKQLLTSRKWSVFISLHGVSTMRAAKRTPSAALERHWNKQSLFLFSRTESANKKIKTCRYIFIKQIPNRWKLQVLLI